MLKKVYGVLALGWRGSARHWARYEKAYLILAGLSTPLVLSVHTVVSFDFAVGDPAGLARDDLPAVLRRRRHLRRLRDGAHAGRFRCARSTTCRTSSPMRHIENMAKVMLVTGPGRRLRLRRARRSSAGTARNEYERFMLKNRIWYGPVRLDLLGAAALQLPRAAADVVEADAAQHRRSSSWSAMFVNVGMWLERFVIIVDEPAPRLHAVVVGDVLPDGLGLPDALRHHRPVRHADVHLRPRAAADFDLRDAARCCLKSQVEAAPRRRRRTDGARHSETPVLRPDGRVRLGGGAARRGEARSRAAGYTKTDAFSPFPIHGLAEALGFHERTVAPIILAGGLIGLLGGLRPRVLDAGRSRTR